MKKMEFAQTADANKKKKRVFYTALGICIVAIGIALYIGITQTIQQVHEDRTIDLDNTSSKTVVQEDDYPEVEDVEKTQSDVAIESQVESEPEETEPEEETVSTAAKPITFAMPLEGETLNVFSNGELVKSQTLNEWRTHDGVDLKAQADTPVKAVCDGTVEDIVEDPLWGVKVTISHADGYESIYCGLKPSVPVKKGAEINVGDIVGYVGNTAEIEIAEESHLHFAMKQNDEWIDPLALIEK